MDKQLIVDLLIDVIPDINIESTNRVKVLSCEAVAYQRSGKFGDLPAASIAYRIQGFFSEDVFSLIRIVFELLLGQRIDGFLEDRIRAKCQAGQVLAVVFDGGDTADGGLLLILLPSSADLDEESGTADQEACALQQEDDDVTLVHLQ